ncbi:AzlD domain-containing protein [Bradyrhizobium sp. SYSU BS000235]|uniref:AzlD domain-containing protein n=1 Tax=Bradyrhizobium sp. SYSU BS000235 TaxID=3411332 RepID=UPI003C76215C
MSELFGSPQAIVLLLVAGFLSNDIWRFLGLLIGGGIDEKSELLVWVRAVAAAILAGVIAQIMITPPGALASVPGSVRFGAMVVGFAAYLVARKSVFAGVVAGEIVVLAGKWWLG